MIEHEKKTEVRGKKILPFRNFISYLKAMIIDEIIKDKLNPRLFDRQVDFIDCVRLLGDIVDSYPFDQQIVKFITNFLLFNKKNNYFSHVYQNFTTQFIPIQKTIMKNS
jgi:hypothetical protein